MNQVMGNRNHQSPQPFRHRYRSDLGRGNVDDVSYDDDDAEQPMGRMGEVVVAVGVGVVVDGSLGRRRMMMKWWVSPVSAIM